MNVTTFHHESGLVLRPGSEHLDQSNARAFKDRSVASLSGEQHLFIDLSAVTYIDSAGLGALVAIFKNLGEGGRMSIVSPHRNVRTLIEITRLDSIFSLLDRLPEAP